MSNGYRPLVSICMPTYNDGRYLRKSLSSIVEQTYDNLEVIVSDDASTDDTEQIVRSFTDRRIAYYKNPKNLGQFDNLNRCIELATGDLIAYYHSDDVYEPNIIKKEVEFLETHPEAGAVFCLDKYIDENDRVFGETKLPHEIAGNTSLEFDEVFAALLRYKNIILRCPTFMARGEVLREAGPFRDDLGMVGDLEMWLRILTQFKIGVINEPLMRYRVSSSQVSRKYNYLRTRSDHFFDVMDSYLNSDAVKQRMEMSNLTEYEFHRCDDETFRAANWIIRGDSAAARELLQRPYPWRSLFTRFRRRKLRVLLLRALMQIGLTLSAVRSLARLLRWTEYGETI